jgi:hypothetical protein
MPHNSIIRQQPQPCTAPPFSKFSFGQQTAQTAEIKGAPTQATGATPAAQTLTLNQKTFQPF